MFDLERDLAELYQMEVEISTDLEMLKYEFDNGTIDLESYQDEKAFLKEKSQKLKGDIQDLENEFKRVFVADNLEEKEIKVSKSLPIDIYYRDFKRHMENEALLKALKEAGLQEWSGYKKIFETSGNGEYDSIMDKKYEEVQELCIELYSEPRITREEYEEIMEEHLEELYGGEDEETREEREMFGPFEVNADSNALWDDTNEDMPVW